MQLGNIDKIGSQEKHFPEALKRAMSFLKRADFSKIEKGKHPLEGEKMFVIFDEYETKSRDDKKAEMHMKFIDVQFIVSGEESMGFSFDNGNSIAVEKYSPEKDAALYDKVDEENYFAVRKGMYVIFYPGEIHRPGCNLNAESEVRKAIVKINIDLL